MANKRNNCEVSRSPTDKEFPSKRVTRNNMQSCKVCAKPVNLEYVGEESVTVMCKMCNDRYHAACVGLTSDFVFKIIQSTRKGWLCYSCHQENFKFMTKLDERLSAVEKQVDLNSHQIKQVNTNADLAFNAINGKIVDSETKLRNEIRELREKIVSPIDFNVDNFIKQTKDEIMQSMQSMNQDPTKASAEADLKYVRNLQRKNNLVIGNVPIQNDESQESLKQVIIKIANALEVNLEPQHIVIIIRLNKKGDKSSSPILVKFIDAVIKHDVFDAYINRVISKNPISFNSIGVNSTQRIFINHHISPELAEIKRKALEFKKNDLVEKVNARYNNIRVFINNKWHNVDSMAALEAIIDGDSPPS